MWILAAITEERQQVFEFARAPDGWLSLLALAALAALCYAVVWFYRREARMGASQRLRIGLATTRCAVIVLLAVIWLDPSIATYTRQTISATVAVLVDDSASMSIVDSPAAPDRQSPRIERVAELLRREDGGWLKRLAARNELRVYSFGERPALLHPPTPATAPTGNGRPTHHDGPRLGGAAADIGSGRPPADTLSALARLTGSQTATDLGQALAAVLEDVGESPLAAVIVLTDGGLNRGLSVADAAALARRHGMTVYPVAVGDPQEPPNVRVTNLSVPATVPLGDPLEVRVHVAGSGLSDSNVGVELLVREAAGAGSPVGRSEERQDTELRVADGETSQVQEPWRTVGTGQLELRREESVGQPPRRPAGVAGSEHPGEAPPESEHAPQIGELRFVVNPDRAGEFVYRATVSPVPGEALHSDNVREASVLVTDQPLRVLIVAGRPSFDYRFVSRLFERDRSIEVSCWLQSADTRAVRDGDTPIVELPRRPEELFQYDAVLLLDPDPRELDSAWAITVRRLVDELGGGLLLAAGPHYTARALADPRLEELTALLPVVPDPDPAGTTALEQWHPFRTTAWPLELVEEAAGHPLLEMNPDPASNRAIWQALPGTWWHLPVLRPKPLATVLLRHSHRPFGNQFGPPVLLAVQPFGAGRTGFLGFDSSWRWRGTGERYFNRFWIQMVRYLALARRQSASRRGTIVLDRETPSAGEFVRIEARVLDESFAPWHESQIGARLELPDGSEQELVLSAITGREGWFAGRVALHQPGSTAIRVPLPRGETTSTAPAESLVKRVMVCAPDRELAELRMHEPELRLLAQRTGGQFVRLEDAGPLPDWIENATIEKPPVPGPRAALWDNAGVLGALATLLAVEWLLRRRNHLL